MKKEIVIVTKHQGAIAVPATIITHPHPIYGELGIHKTVDWRDYWTGCDRTGCDWSISHVRTGITFCHCFTRTEAIDWAEWLDDPTDEEIKIIKYTESAPPLEEAKPYSP